MNTNLDEFVGLGIEAQISNFEEGRNRPIDYVLEWVRPCT